MTSERTRRLPVALAAALLAIAASGCGGDEEQPLTSGRGETLVDLLDDAEGQFEDGECDELADTLDDFSMEIAAIQEEVQAELRSTLETETEELIQLAEQCQEPEVITETETAPAPPPETVEPTEPTEPPTTEEETTEETTEEEEPSGNGPDGGGPPGQEDGGGGE